MPSFGNSFLEAMVIIFITRSLSNHYNTSLSGENFVEISRASEI